MNEPDLMEIHREMLRRIVVGRVGLADCEDVLQEVALATHRGNVPSDTKQQKYWLCAVAIRQCARHLRRAYRKAESGSLEVASSADARQVADPIDDPVFFLMARESREQVALAVRSLSDEARKLLMAKVVQGMTYEQIAQRYGLTKDKVEYRIGVARKKLKRRMIQLGFGEED